jgi:hypothetical protein
VSFFRDGTCSLLDKLLTCKSAKVVGLPIFLISSFFRSCENKDSAELEELTAKAFKEFVAKIPTISNNDPKYWIGCLNFLDISIILINSTSPKKQILMFKNDN